MQHFKKISIFGVFIAIYIEKRMMSLFYMKYLGFLHIVEENLCYVWNHVEILSKKHVLFNVKILIGKIDFLT